MFVLTSISGRPLHVLYGSRSISNDNDDDNDDDDNDDNGMIEAVGVPFSPRYFIFKPLIDQSIGP